MIVFEEDDSSNYANRTKKNAMADVTIAIAFDFKTAGEKLTKKSVLNNNKLYLPVSLEELHKEFAGQIIGNYLTSLSKSIISLNKEEITLNIAGNGIYTLQNSHYHNQKVIDGVVHIFLKELIKRLDNKIKITEIRSGGQTGVDEAGIKAAVKLNIPARILAPKGWCFRDKNGDDIFNEEQFKDRFK